MVHKLILHEEEYKVLQKVLQAVPPATAPKLAGLDGAELYFYRRVLTQVLKKDFTFPDTDDGRPEKETLIYGYPPHVWNSMSEGEQENIMTRCEYDLQHPDQADWFVD